jgi:hypothetical protein
MIDLSKITYHTSTKPADLPGGAPAGSVHVEARDNPWIAYAIAATEARAKEIATLVVTGQPYKASLRSGEAAAFGKGNWFWGGGSLVYTKRGVEARK